MVNQPAYQLDYSSLNVQIAEFKRIAEVYARSSIDDSGVSQSLSTTVNAILALPNNISADLPFNQITGVEKTLKDAEKLFRAYGKEEIGKMLNEIAPSRTFRALAGTAQFEKILSTLKGQSIEVNGKPTTIDNAHIYALTRFNVSIGNPIANPKSFELFMKSLLGGVDIRELRHIRDILLPDDQVNYEEITALQKDILKLEKAFPKTSEDQEELLQKKGQLKAAQEKIKKNQKKRKTLKTTFDKITGSLHAMATTRGYTTKKEIQEFVQGSFTSPELRGATGLTASVINGNTQTAIRILKDQLFRKTTHETKTGVKLASFDQNIWFVEEKDPLISHPQEDSSQQKPGILNQDFFNHMIENPNQYCVVQMSHIPAGLFQELEETYPGQHQAILGRLIIVTKTNKGEASSATMVYHILPELTERLDACCDRELGRPSRIQLQLYELFSKISIEELTELKAAVEKNRQARNQQGASKSLETLSAHPYLADERSEYNMYKGFEKLLNFFIDLHDPQKRETRAKEELEEFENQYHAYFAGKDVPKKTFDCVAIPTGGGREELTMIFGYCAKQLRETAANFQEIETSGDLHPNSSKPNAVSSIIKTIKTKVRGQTGETTKSIGVCRARLNELIKKRYGSNADVTLGPLPIDTARRIVEERQNPSIATDGNLGSSILTMAGDMTEIGLREGATKVEGIAGSVRSAIEGISRMPVLNGVRKTLIGKSKRNGLNQNAKRTERSFENLGAQTAPLRAAVAGFAALPGIIETGAGRLRQFTQTEIPNLALIFNTLNALEQNTFKPILVSSFQSWTYGEVVNKDEYPDANHCDIPMDTDGTPNIEEFETYLRRRKESFQGFPELCELDCKRHIFILCDPSNPNGAVWPEAKKRHLLQLAQRYKFTIIADTAYHKLIDKSTKEAQGDPMFTRFAHNQTGLVAPLSKKLDFPLFESIPSTKWNNPDRTGCIWSNQTSFRGYVSTNLSDSRNTMALYQENALIHTGIAVKKVCKAFETEKDPLEILTTLLSDQKNFPEINDLTHRNFSPIVHMRLIRALNEMKQVASRSLPQEVAKNKRKYASKLITELKKENRQEKITQIDAQERYKCIAKGIEELAEEFKTSSDPELKTIGENLRERCSSPQAAFYFTLQLGEKSVDSNMKDFLAEIAQKRHIGVVGWEKGLVRFSFGGFLNGEGMDYDLLKLNIKTELRILLTYWQKFTKNREQTRVHSSPQLTVEEAGEKALAELFSGDSETHVAKTLEEKSELVAQLIKQYGKTKTMALLGSHWNADLESYMHKVEADSPITVVNLPSVDCEDVNSLMESELFGNFFNHYLLEVASKIPELQGLTPGQILQNYGFIEFKNYHKSQQIPSHIKPILEKIALEIYQHWHSAKNITFITQPHDSNQSISDRANNLRIAVYKFFGAFVSQQNQPIAENLRDKSIAKMGYTTRRVMASNSLPSWSQKIINQTPMVDKVTSLQDSPSAQEASTTRIAGHDQGIYKRDSEKNARNSEEHRSRLEQFAKEYDPDKYTLKMMQIGPKRVLLVLNKGFESQLMQDYRLNPQYSLTDIAPEGLDQVNPECIYFMGIPEHVMGSSSKVGYYFDKTASGENLPVGWVTTDMLHEYTGYLKKPALTLVNELVLDMGGLPIHGSAFTITTKDGRTKTVVLGGDSGAGKSETLTAMTEKVIAELGGPDNIQYIDLLAGDMVSLWIDDDGDFSVMGTEQGDFMRMKDIGQNWQERYKYLIDFASSTNLGDANAREMISGLCDIEKFTHLNKVDVLAAVNNSQEPPGGNPYQLVENPAELLTNTFILGERIEKKTSGDQPNLHLSLWGTYQESKLTNGKTDNKSLENITTYGTTLDKYLGWDTLISTSTGKVKNAFLRFNNIPGGRIKADQMVNDLFRGRKITEDNDWRLSEPTQQVETTRLRAVQAREATEAIKNKYEQAKTSFENMKQASAEAAQTGIAGKDNQEALTQTQENLETLEKEMNEHIKTQNQTAQEALNAEKAEYITWTIQAIKYDAVNNRYNISLQNGQQKKQATLDRNIFDRIYVPYVSTYGGIPFIDPERMNKSLGRYADAAKNNPNLETVVVYTQLGKVGRTISGPINLAGKMVEGLTTSPKAVQSDRKKINLISEQLTAKYGSAILQGRIGATIQRTNLARLNKHRHREACAIDFSGNVIPMHTPGGFTNQRSSKTNFSDVTLLPPEFNSTMASILDSAVGSSTRNLTKETSEKASLTPFQNIKTYDSKNELIYQILLIQGKMRLEDTESLFLRNPQDLFIAEQIAARLMEKGTAQKAQASA